MGKLPSTSSCATTPRWPKAVGKLTRHREELLAFYESPGEH